MTRQFTPEEVAELQARIEAGNKELAEFESQQNQQTEEGALSMKIKKLLRQLRTMQIKNLFLSYKKM